MSASRGGGSEKRQGSGVRPVAGSWWARGGLGGLGHSPSVTITAAPPRKPAPQSLLWPCYTQENPDPDARCAGIRGSKKLLERMQRPRCWKQWWGTQRKARGAHCVKTTSCVWCNKGGRQMQLGSGPPQGRVRGHRYGTRPVRGHTLPEREGNRLEFSKYLPLSGNEV